MTQSCFICGDHGTSLFDYVICEACKAQLGFYTDETIKKHAALYEKSSKKHSYGDEIQERLVALELNYVKQRIKLLHIQERLQRLARGR